MRKVLAIFISVLLCTQTVYAAPPEDGTVYEKTDEAAETTGEADAGTEEADGDGETDREDTLSLSAESALIMEASTGKVLYEKDADTQKPPASVTKVMTMLLIFDAIEAGKIRPEDQVTVSEFAASMGGSQVFLEPGETQTVDTMLKCIAVSSANDACAAMAEFVSGSEDAFVEAMNERAKGLGMEHTHFVNCNGLDTDGHLTTARDIALMSRELITKYPKIHDYTMIWMENITHTTKKGSSEFGLSNTNKLIRQYEYATGLKTGSTGKAKFCLSATAKKDEIEMIAVVMAEPDAKMRVKDAVTMLNYGFSRCSRYLDEKVLEKKVAAKVKRGCEKLVEGEVKESFEYIDTDGIALSEIQKKTEINEMKAPVKKGAVIGKVCYMLGEKVIGEVQVTAKDSVEKITFHSALLEVLEKIVV